MGGGRNVLANQTPVFPYLSESMLVSAGKALGEQKPFQFVRLCPWYLNIITLLQNNGVLLTVNEESAFLREQDDIDALELVILLP